MYEALEIVISSFSLLIGVIGILIIVMGSLKGLYFYVLSRDEHNFQHVRLVLGSHIILGLDFMVGKDIIDTILLDSGNAFWQDIASLVTVVGIRIILTHFMLKEVKQAKLNQD